MFLKKLMIKILLAFTALALGGVAYADKGVFSALMMPGETLTATPTTVTITAEIGADATNPLLGSSVTAYETTADGQPVAPLGMMYDDGTHGDQVAADTIFTMQLNVNEAAARTRYFRVTAAYSKVRNRYLGPVMTLNVYPPLPAGLVDQIIATLQALQDGFNANVASLGVDGARQKALADALGNPNIGPGNANLAGPNLALTYVYWDPASEYTFHIRGINILMDPNNPSDAAGRSVPANLPVDYKGPGNDKLLIFGPGYQAADPQNAIVEHAQSQFNNTEYMTFDPNPPVITARENASLEVVKHWGDYGTVIIHTHGGVWNGQVVLVSGTPASLWNQLSYMLDLITGRIGIAGDSRFVFYPSFITQYVSGMKNTFLYLGACESLMNDTLWNALKAKGAKVAFGWSETVNRQFNGDTFARLIDPMLPHTNPPDPLTAKQAFDAVAPKTDPWGGHNATLTMRTASADWEKFVFAEGGIVNGDFETGNFTGWVHGANPGNLYGLVTGARKHGGAWAGAMGRWDTVFTGNDPTLEPYGYEWIYQDFTVPSNATTLSFWWWQETYDTAVWDWFDAYLQNASGGTLMTLVNHGGKPGSNYGPYWNTGGWQYVTANVTAYRGQKVRIYFDQRLDGYGDQTRSYVDDVKVQ